VGAVVLVHSSRRTWSVAREPSRQTWNGSKQISAAGTAARIARWYSPLMSDRADRVPADPQQAADRRERHLVGQPGHDVFEVAGVRRARTRPRDRLEPDAAIPAPEPAQLALDPAATRPQIEVAPALDAPVVDLQLAEHTRQAAPQAYRDDRSSRGERDIDHAGAGQAQQALECGGDAHVVLLARPLISTTSSLL
jgi:hypothetical protein